MPCICQRSVAEANKRKRYEILDHVQAIGVHLRAKDGKYKLAAMGHGVVGAALATLCSFYATGDKRFLTIGPAPLPLPGSGIANSSRPTHDDDDDDDDEVDIDLCHFSRLRVLCCSYPR